MIMGTAQKQNIAVQHRMWNMNKTPEIMTCEEWRDHRFRQMKEAGEKIGYNKEYDLYRISWPEKERIIVSQAEIEDDWKRCYLHKEVKA
jgi:hypothetical protein